MDGSISQILQGGIASERDRQPLRTIFSALAHCISAQSLNSAGLVIKGAASPTVKTGATTYYASARGILVSKAAATDMPALVGTVANATFNVFGFYIDLNGNLTSAMGTAGMTLGRVKFPPLPPSQAMIGFIIINPTGTGNFVGGTTALDDATVAPNTAYISTTGGQLDTTILVNG
jgi:hypothetical protein